MDRFGMGTDYSNDPEFTEAVAKKVYYGPVNLSEKSEPNMTLSVAGTRQGTGVTSARVNLRLIQDLVTKIKVSEHGVACVLDNRGRVIAHTDASLVLKDFSSRPREGGESGTHHNQ